MLQNQQETPHQDANASLPALSNSQREIQAATETPRQQMLPEEVEALMAVVQTEAQKRKQQNAIKHRMFIVLCGLMVLMVAVFLIHGFGAHHGKGGDWFTFFSYSGVLGYGAAAASKKQKEAAGKLAQSEDLRVVGPLCDTLDTEDKNVRAVLAEALTRLLPRLQASDAGLLNVDQRAKLNQVLKQKRWLKQTGLVIAVLNAYRQVGDSKALPLVAKLAAEQDLSGRPLPETSIQAAAKECLPFLQQRAEQERASQSLLRAAAAPATPSEVLLRPAQAGASTSDPQQLLRPGNL